MRRNKLTEEKMKIRTSKIQNISVDIGDYVPWIPDYACASLTAVVEATSNESVTTVLCLEFYVRYSTVRDGMIWRD